MDAEEVKGWREGSKNVILILGKIRAGYNENSWGEDQILGKTL
jgi:hypothetical protein